MNPLQEQELRQLVISELMALGYKPKGQSIVIHCPYHNDKHPSCHVHIGNKFEPGFHKCFSCGGRGGWNDLARIFQMNNYDYKEGNKNNFKTEKKQESNDPFKMFENYLSAKPILVDDIPRMKEGLESLPSDFEWRGVPKATWDKLGASLYWSRNEDIEFLHLPITRNGEYMGYTLCALEKRQNNKPKYEIYANTSKNFLLFDQLRSNEPVILCEGHFDAIRLYHYGYNALCVFGVENWSTFKRTLLYSKVPTKVIILFDGDDAGYRAAQKIYPELAPGVDTDIMYLPLLNPPIDPGNMGNEYFELLNQKILEVKHA